MFMQVVFMGTLYDNSDLVDPKDGMWIIRIESLSDVKKEEERRVKQEEEEQRTLNERIDKN